jgi:hypothetical protein
MSGGLTLGRSAEGRDARAVIDPSLHQLAPLLESSPAPISALCAQRACSATSSVDSLSTSPAPRTLVTAIQFLVRISNISPREWASRGGSRFSVRRRIRSSVFEASDRLVHGLEHVRASCAAAGRVLPDRYRVCSRRYQTARSSTFAIDAATGTVPAPMSVVAIVPSAVTNRRFPCRCGAIPAAIRVFQTPAPLGAAALRVPRRRSYDGR